MLACNTKEFIEFFKDIEDPRQDEKVLYPLHEIIFLVLVGVMNCAEGWQEILDFGREKMHILKKYFSYVNGLPSISTLLRLIGLIDRKHMETWLNNNAISMLDSLENELLVLDGKSLKGKKKFSNNNQNTHVLNVFASGLGLVLGQKSIPEKTNEITAMHEVLDAANLSGTTVSIDAMGCQTAIAEKIITKGGEYFLSLKGNQGTLLSDVECMFAAKSYVREIFEAHDKGHGRIETRICETIADVGWLKANHPNWKNLTSVSKVISTRIIGATVTTEARYYISSTAADAKKHLQYSRQHWAIENNLHWVLDVQFKEDDSLVRIGNAAENMSAVRKMVINILKKYKVDKKIKRSTNGLRKLMGWSEGVMVDVLNSWIYSCS